MTLPEGARNVSHGIERALPVSKRVAQAGSETEPSCSPHSATSPPSAGTGQRHQQSWRSVDAFLSAPDRAPPRPEASVPSASHMGL